MNDHICVSGDIIAVVFCMIPLFFLSIFLSVIFTVIYKDKKNRNETREEKRDKDFRDFDLKIKELERKFENLDRKHR